MVSEATESRAGDGLAPRVEVFFENVDSGSATPSFPTSWSASSQGFNGSPDFPLIFFYARVLTLSFQQYPPFLIILKQSRTLSSLLRRPNPL